ncbi:MAG: hypothetical protein K8R69_00875 [Deltaproteobacteria bacterium]|nr:hypothetical protein [Deltaproteobacteria bacterium]
MTELQDLSERQQAFLLIAALKEGERATALLDCVGEGRTEETRQVLDALLKQTKKYRPEEFQKAFASLGSEGKVSLWSQADPGWILDSLRGESPLVWALVFRELPRAKVGRVLAELPKEMRKLVKSMANNVPADQVWAHLKKGLEARFPAVSREIWDHPVDFINFHRLSADQFMLLMRELGLSEMAVAFAKVDRTATRAILHRLGVEEAKELRNRIKKGGHDSPEVMREAQMNILSLEVEKLKTEELTLEIGFSVFSRAFGPEHRSLTPIFVYKIPPRYGYVLKRYLDLNIPRNHPEKAQKVRERIGAALERLRPQFS